MAKIEIFNNEKFGTIRVKLDENGNVWFAGKDLGIALGYVNPSKAVRDLVGTEDKKLVQLADFQEGSNLDPSSKGSKLTIINESGFYALVLSSKLETAKDFKHWVTHDVLPSIRKTGSYTLVQQYETPKIDERLLKLEQDKVNAQSAQILKDLSNSPFFGDKMKQVLQIKSANFLMGKGNELPLPTISKMRYNAGQVGQKLGITANMVGRIANKLNLKNPQYGEFVDDTAKYNKGKQVKNFEYYDEGIQRIKEELDNTENNSNNN